MKKISPFRVLFALFACLASTLFALGANPGTNMLSEFRPAIVLPASPGGGVSAAPALSADISAGVVCWTGAPSMLEGESPFGSPGGTIAGNYSEAERNPDPRYFAGSPGRMQPQRGMRFCTSFWRT